MLRALFPNVCDLLSYFRQLGGVLESEPDWQHSAWNVEKDDDCIEYKYFLRNTMVARAIQAKNLLPPSQGEVIFSQAEVGHIVRLN